MNEDRLYTAEMPDRAVISVTERCNSRCTFCSIWQTESPTDLDLDLLDKLPSSITSVDVTGGEPLMHKEFPRILEKLDQRNCRINLNTNGWISLKKYEALIKSVKDLAIRFSLDGIEDKHDTLRGIKGNYRRVIEQIKYLQSIRLQNIGISSTFSDINIDQALPLYELSRSFGISFTCMVAGNSEVYYKTSDNVIENSNKIEDALRKVIGREMRSCSSSRWKKVIYLDGLADFAAGRIKVLECSAGSNFLFLKPDGTVYACNMRDLPMGSLHEADFEALWNSAEACSSRKKALKCAAPCWTMCNAKSIIQSNKREYCGKFLRHFPRNFTG